MAYETRGKGQVRPFANAVRRTLSTSWPLALENVAVAVNGLITAAFLSNDSAAAVTAVLTSSTLAGIFSAFFTAVFGYSGTIVARRFGGGRSADAVRVFGQGLVLTFASLPLFLSAIPAGWLALSAFGHSSATFSAEKDYFTLLMVAGFLSVLAQVLAGLFTGQGKTRFVGIIMTLGVVLNAGLTPAFVSGTPHPSIAGVCGAGTAAILSNGMVAAVLAIRVAFDPLIRGSRGIISFDRGIAAEILIVGLPNGLRHLVDSAGFFIFVAMIARLDPMSVAASTAVFAINNLHHSFAIGVSAATEILTGRNLGADRADAVRADVNAALSITAASLALFAAVLALLGETMLGWFLPSNCVESSAFFRTGHGLYLVLALKLPFEIPLVILAGTLRGLGDTSFIFKAQSFVSFAVWLPLVFAVNTLHPTVTALWLTMVVSSAFTAGLFVRHYTFIVTTHAASRGAFHLPPAANNTVNRAARYVR